MEKKVRKEFGIFLKRTRIKAKITQLEIAQKCGYKNAQFISNIERGQCWAPIPILVEMSKAYKISRSELLEKLVFYRKKLWAHEMGLDSKNKNSK